MALMPSGKSLSTELWILLASWHVPPVCYHITLTLNLTLTLTLTLIRVGLVSDGPLVSLISHSMHSLPPRARLGVRVKLRVSVRVNSQAVASEGSMKDAKGT